VPPAGNADSGSRGEGQAAHGPLRPYHWRISARLIALIAIRTARNDSEGGRSGGERARASGREHVMNIPVLSMAARRGRLGRRLSEPSGEVACYSIINSGPHTTPAHTPCSRSARALTRMPGAPARMPCALARKLGPHASAPKHTLHFTRRKVHPHARADFGSETGGWSRLKARVVVFSRLLVRPTTHGLRSADPTE